LGGPGTLKVTLTLRAHGKIKGKEPVKKANPREETFSSDEG